VCNRIEIVDHMRSVGGGQENEEQLHYCAFLICWLSIRLVVTCHCCEENRCMEGRGWEIARGREWETVMR
jgi:hypothetical protein